MTNVVAAKRAASRPTSPGPCRPMWRICWPGSPPKFRRALNWHRAPRPGWTPLPLSREILPARQRPPSANLGASASASSFGANTQFDAEDLAYILREVTEDDSAARLSDAIYETFRLQAFDIPGAAPHPTKLVQSAAMASVAPPETDLPPEAARCRVAGRAPVGCPA